MTRYLVQPRNRIFVKDYEFLSFAKTMAQNIEYKRLVISLSIELIINLQKSQKLYHRIFQKQMTQKTLGMIERYREKNIANY